MLEIISRMTILFKKYLAASGLNNLPCGGFTRVFGVSGTKKAPPSEKDMIRTYNLCEVFRKIGTPSNLSPVKMFHS